MLLAVSHHSDRFADNRYCDKSDLMFLTYHVVLRDHMFKGVCNFVGDSFS